MFLMKSNIENFVHMGCRIFIFFTVGAQYTESTEVVKEMPLYKRECLKHDENMQNHPDIHLKAFANYSRKACIMECQAEDIFKKCHCLPYYFPDFSSIWKKDTSCNYTGYQCLANISGKCLKHNKY